MPQYSIILKLFSCKVKWYRLGQGNKLQSTYSKTTASMNDRLMLTLTTLISTSLIIDITTNDQTVHSTTNDQTVKTVSTAFHSIGYENPEA